MPYAVLSHDWPYSFCFVVASQERVGKFTNGFLNLGIQTSCHHSSKLGWRKPFERLWGAIRQELDYQEQEEYLVMVQQSIIILHEP